MKKENILKCSLAITNMSSEMFNDALFYKELADETENIFSKWRFYRSSLINYCISVEVWINKIVVKGLEKKDNLNEKEKKLFTILTEELEYLPSDINLSINAKLKTYIPKLYDFEIKKGSDLYVAIENYKEITRFRNKIIHYSQGNYEKVYNTDELKSCIDNAPKNIQILFDEMYKLSGKLDEIGYPNWVKDRKSREI